MSDWDILAPVEDGDNQDDQENDDNDGVFFGDGGVDNDSFGTHEGPGPSNIGNEAQSFNPRIYDHSKRHDFFDNNVNAGLENEKGAQPHDQATVDQQLNRPYQPPQVQQSYYKDMANSYTCRKIHDSPEMSGYKNSKRRGRSRGPRGGRHMTSDSDSATSFLPRELLEDGFDENIYIEFHDAALQQRAELGIGKSNEMNSLFYFWCYYLRTHFDQSMYDEFLEIAKKDASENSHYGIECYFRLCSYGLEKRWDPQVFAQFQDEALDDYKKGSTYGIEKVKGFLENQKYDFEIKPTPEMEAVLSKFPTFESFKREKSNNSNNNQNNYQPRSRKAQYDDAQVTKARSIPKHRNFESNISLGSNFNQPPNSPNANSNNFQKHGYHQKGGAANNSPNNFNRPRGGGNQSRKQQFRHKNDEPREWTFGKMQPSSAPKPDNMNLNNQKH